MLYAARVAGNKGVRYSSVEVGVEYVRGVESGVRRCFHFKVAGRVLQTTGSDKNLDNFLQNNYIRISDGNSNERAFT